MAFLFKRQVEFGGCFNRGALVITKCTADEEDCLEEGLPYLSHHDIIQAHDETGHPPSFCQSEFTEAGRCGQYCTNSPFSCGSFHEDSTCNMMYDETTKEATIYGGCIDGVTNEIKCVWDPMACTVSEEFLSAEKLLEMGRPCFCADVETGLCYAPGNKLYCAVQPNSCGPTEHWVTATALRANPEMYDYLDCRVCKALFPKVVLPENPKPIVALTPFPTPAPTPSPTPFPTPLIHVYPTLSGGALPEMATEQSEPASARHTGWIVGSIVTILFCFTGVLFAVVRLRRRSPPTKTIEAASPRIPPTFAFEAHRSPASYGFQMHQTNEYGADEFHDVHIDRLPESGFLA